MRLTQKRRNEPERKRKRGKERKRERRGEEVEAAKMSAVAIGGLSRPPIPLEITAEEERQRREGKKRRGKVGKRPHRRVSD